MLDKPFCDDELFRHALRFNGLILDTNVAALLIVSKARVDLQKEPRTSHFSQGHLKAMEKCIELAPSRKIITTPHIASEIVHILGVEPNRKKKETSIVQKRDYTKSAFTFLADNYEKSTSTSEIINKSDEQTLREYGLVDLSILHAFNPNKKEAFVTSDEVLCGFLASMGLPATTIGRIFVLYVENNL